MEQMEQSGTDGVILENKPSVLPTNAEEKFKSRNWSFTLNNYTEKEMEQMEHFSNCLMVFGKETGEQDTPHLQGYLELKNPRTLSGLKKALGINRIHLEPSYKNRYANVKYCTKQDAIVRNDFGETYIGKDLPKLEDLYEWQLYILDLIEKEPDDRHIYWFYEPHGRGGKTKFGKYLCFHHPQVCLLTCTKSADILTVVDPKFKTYVLDFPRSLGPDFCPYNGIEQLKNGFVSDSKLKKQARLLMFNPPHVIIFSNEPPNRTKLSADRWQVYNIHTNTWEL